MTLFPTVSGQNLEGRRFILPRDFEGERSVVLVAFQQWQQYTVNDWLPHIKTLAQRDPALRYYELPTLPQFNPVRQWMLNNGMKMGIPDLHTRETTITLYLDLAAFCRALAIPNLEQVELFLVTRAGDILWRERGAYTPEKLASLAAHITI
jgi:hypothetical protein